MRLAKRTPTSPQTFLVRVFRHAAEGFCFLAAKAQSGGWSEHPIPANALANEIEPFLDCHDRHRFDLYFCPNTFSAKRRLRRFCLPTNFAWCDVDGGNIESFQPPPSIVTSTSPGRHQALWEFKQPASPEYAEALSRHLAYQFGGDKNGWSCTKYLRIPFTFNHKAAYDMPDVKLLRTVRPMAAWPQIEASSSQNAFDSISLDAAQYAPAAVLDHYRKRIRSNYLSLMRHQVVLSRDRSRCIYMIVAALYDAGADRNEIASVVWASPYFQSKHGPCKHKLEEEIARIIGKLR